VYSICISANLIPCKRGERERGRRGKREEGEEFYD
jgi:hypothetical protein